MTRLEVLPGAMEVPLNMRRIREWETRNGEAGSVTVSSLTYAIPATVRTVLVDDSANAVAIILPEVGDVTGLDLRIKLVGPGTNGVTVTPSDDSLIDSSESLAISVSMTAYTLHSDGTNYWIV